MRIILVFFIKLIFLNLDSSRGNSSDLTPENSVGSETSDSTVIFLPHRDVASDSSMLNESGQELRHPVIDRITGQHAGAAGLRNESYYRVRNTFFFHRFHNKKTINAGNSRLHVEHE